jgi:hypothetical protein
MIISLISFEKMDDDILESLLVETLIELDGVLSVKASTMSNKLIVKHDSRRISSDFIRSIIDGW